MLVRSSQAIRSLSPLATSKYVVNWVDLPGRGVGPVFAVVDRCAGVTFVAAMVCLSLLRRELSELLRRELSESLRCGLSELLRLKLSELSRGERRVSKCMRYPKLVKKRTTSAYQMNAFVYLFGSQKVIARLSTLRR